MPGIIAGGAGLLIVSALCLLIARSGRQGTLDRNTALGLRTKATLASDEGWIAAHRAAAPRLIVTGAIGIFFSVLALGLAPWSLPLGGSALVAGYVGLVVILLLATARANAAAKDLSVTHPDRT